jgi:hypothetical protein
MLPEPILLIALAIGQWAIIEMMSRLATKKGSVNHG